MEQLILNVWDKTLVKKKRVYSLPLTRKREQSCLTSWNRQKTLIVFLQLTFFGLMRGFIHPFFICKIGVCSQFNTNLSTNEKVIGLIALMDIPSENAKATIEYFKKCGVHTTLITGDSEMTGQAVGKQLGVDQVIANVMPEDKSNIINEQKERYGITAMVGDGVNDAPALVKADVGIAMGEGTDVAVDVSDLVLMKNDLSKLVKAHKISLKMNRVIWQNIIFSMLVVAFLIIVSLLGLTDIAISVIVHEGSTLVVILNGLRLLKSK